MTIVMKRHQLMLHHSPSGLSFFSFGIFILTCCASNCHAGRILVPFLCPFASRSHHIAIESIARGLSERGHHITFLMSNSSINQDGIHAFKIPANKTIVFNALRSGEDEMADYQRRCKNMQDKTTSVLQLMKEVHTMVDHSADECNHFFEQTEIVNELLSDKYDVFLSHVFLPCEVLLGSYLKTVSVFVTGTLRFPSFHEDILGMPLPTAYVPSVLSSFTDKMTFLQRLQNFILRVTFNLRTRLVFHRPFSHVQRKHNISIHKTVTELHSDAALWLCHLDRTLDWARPVTPNWISIGGITARPAEHLPPDLEEFVQGSGNDGVIVFTLGAAAHALYNEELLEIFASVFGQLRQRILWRQDGPLPKNVANNVKIVKWLPQNDLLGHPKTRLLIYHGGSNGVHEAIYHAVPMVIFPYRFDQFALGAATQDKGIGLVLQKHEITEERLESTINTVLNDPRFRKRVEHLSAIYHDSPQTPQQRAVFWIEHVMQFGGDHLRPRAADMSFIELYMIDVAVFLALLCSLILYLEYLVMKKCLICFNCVKRKTKKKKE